MGARALAKPFFYGYADRIAIARHCTRRFRYRLGAVLRPVRAISDRATRCARSLIRFEAERARSLAKQPASPKESLSATVAKICATDKSIQRFCADRTFRDLGQGCLLSLQSSAL